MRPRPARCRDARAIAAGLLAALAVAACGRLEIPPQATYAPDQGYRFENVAKPGPQDRLFVALVFSGGGTRAAAWSYGVLDALRGAALPDGRRLLDEVDLISSVSGGGFTSAYYGLFGDRLFTDFRSRFLEVDIQAMLFWRALLPGNWFRLPTADFSRSDLVAEYYHDHLFEQCTFADLVQAQRRPYLIFNATDMSLGAQFEFTQDQFDLIGSDLGPLPVAWAVAASSAFPVLLSPLTLDRHPPAAGFIEPRWVELALGDMQNNPERYRRAVQVRSYLADNQRRYLHLLDGGLSDNLGVRGMWQRVMSSDKIIGFGHEKRFRGLDLMRRLQVAADEPGHIDRLVVIIANAKPGLDFSVDRSARVPGLLPVIGTVTSAPLATVTEDSVAMVRRDVAQLAASEQLLKQRDRSRYYVIEANFDLVPEPDGGACKRVATNFNLPTRDIDLLIRSAHTALANDSEYRRLAKDLGIGAAGP